MFRHVFLVSILFSTNLNAEIREFSAEGGIEEISASEFHDGAFKFSLVGRDPSKTYEISLDMSISLLSHRFHTEGWYTAPYSCVRAPCPVPPPVWRVREGNSASVRAVLKCDSWSVVDTYYQEASQPYRNPEFTGNFRFSLRTRQSCENYELKIETYGSNQSMSTLILRKLELSPL